MKRYWSNGQIVMEMDYDNRMSGALERRRISLSLRPNSLILPVFTKNLLGNDMRNLLSVMFMSF